MASITKRNRQSGVVYEVVIRRKKKGEIILRETEFFKKHQNAKSWAAKREAQLDDPAVLKKAIEKYSSGDKGAFKSSEITVEQLLDSWVHEEGISKAHRRSYYFSTKLMKNYDIAKIKVNDFKAGHLIKYVSVRAEEGVKPQTINHDISTLRSAFKYAQQFWEVEGLELTAFEVAVPKLKKDGGIKKSDERDRRVTDEELEPVFFNIVVAFNYPVFCNLSSRSGFRYTASDNSQLRVLPLHRSGCFAFAAA